MLRDETRIEVTRSSDGQLAARVVLPRNLELLPVPERTRIIEDAFYRASRVTERRIMAVA